MNTKAKIPFMDFINGLVDREGRWINIWIERMFVCQGGMIVLSSLRYEIRLILWRTPRSSVRHLHFLVNMA